MNIQEVEDFVQMDAILVGDLVEFNGEEVYVIERANYTDPVRLTAPYTDRVGLYFSKHFKGINPKSEWTFYVLEEFKLDDVLFVKHHRY